jgi:hypothetical protein
MFFRGIWDAIANHPHDWEKPLQQTLGVPRQ